MLTMANIQLQTGQNQPEKFGLLSITDGPSACWSNPTNSPAVASSSRMLGFPSSKGRAFFTESYAFFVLLRQTLTVRVFEPKMVLATLKHFFLSSCKTKVRRSQ